MLPEKPWTTDGVLRLFASVLICIFIGSLASSTLRFFSAEEKGHVVLFVLSAVGALAMYLIGLIQLWRTWPFERFNQRFLSLLACVYLGFVLTLCALYLRGETEPANSIARTLIAVLSFQGAALVLIGRFLRWYRTGWAEAFGFKNGSRRAVLLGVEAAFAVFLVTWFVRWGVQLVMEHGGMQPQEQTAVEVLRAANVWSERLVLGLATIVLVPPAEEMLFRGVLYPAIKQAGYPRLALWGTSLLFAAIHFNLAIFVPLTFLAVVLVWIYERTENLLASIVTHSVFNAINFALLYAAPLIEAKFRTGPHHPGP